MQIVRNILFVLFVLAFLEPILAQEKFEESIFYKPVLHLGLQTGASQYLGELNTRWNFKSTRTAQHFYLGKNFFREQLNLKIAYSFVQLYAADKNARDKLQQTRNLDFRSDVSEVSLHMLLKLFEVYFSKKDAKVFLHFGGGYMWFDPYTYYQNEKIFLRPLGTEGQFSYLHSNPTPYSNHSITTPLGVEIKISLTNFWKLNFNFDHRFTSTGYLDDVFENYVGYEAFPPSGNGYNGDLARELQNRSKDIAFGMKGSPRGNMTSDQFTTFSIGLEYHFWKNVYKHRLKYKRLQLPSRNAKTIEEQ